MGIRGTVAVGRLLDRNDPKRLVQKLLLHRFKIDVLKILVVGVGQGALLLLLLRIADSAHQAGLANLAGQLRIAE